MDFSGVYVPFEVVENVLSYLVPDIVIYADTSEYHQISTVCRTFRVFMRMHERDIQIADAAKAMSTLECLGNTSGCCIQRVPLYRTVFDRMFRNPFLSDKTRRFVLCDSMVFGEFMHMRSAKRFLLAWFRDCIGTGVECVECSYDSYLYRVIRSIIETNGHGWVGPDYIEDIDVSERYTISSSCGIKELTFPVIDEQRYTNFDGTDIYLTLRSNGVDANNKSYEYVMSKYDDDYDYDEYCSIGINFVAISRY